MKTIYRIIRDEDSLYKLIEFCKQTGTVSIDFETNGYHIWESNFYPTILGISFQPGSSWIIPLAHKSSPFKDKWKSIFKIFSDEVITNPSIVKIAWNLTFEYSIFLKYGYRMRGRIFDAMIAKYLLDETRPNGLKDMVDRFLPYFSGYELPNTPSSNANRNTIIKFWSNVELEDLSKYCGGDTDFTFRLFIYFENELIEQNLYRLFRSMYMPLIRILSKSRLKGIRIDVEYLKFLSHKFYNDIVLLEKSLREIPLVAEYEELYIQNKIDTKIKELEDEISYGDLSERQISNKEEKISNLEAGIASSKKEESLFEPINFNSPKQLADLLYNSENGFLFPIIDTSETGNPSTAEATLEKLKPLDSSGFINKLLELRGLTKMYSTYVKNILEEQLCEDNRLHPEFVPIATVTGRFGSRNPNFQNIPRVISNPHIKKYILPDKSDQVIVEIDGSQMELRAIASIADDKAMKEIFRSGKNIHVATASKITGVDYDLIDKARKDESHPKHIWAVKEHKKAKVTNFGIIYGMTGYKLAEQLTLDTGYNHSVEEADELINDWFKAFPGVDRYIHEIHEKAKKMGQVSSPINRVRRLPILLDPKNKIFSKGEFNEALRQAGNSVIQGFASDITQWANINIYEAALKGELPSYILMYSTVHDSLEYSVNIEDIHKVVPVLQKIAGSMENMEKYLGGTIHGVDMKFSAELGITWGHMHEYSPDVNYHELLAKDIEEFNQYRIQNNIKLFE